MKPEGGSGKFDLNSLDAKFRKIAGNVNPADFEDKHKSRLEVVRISMKDFLNNSLLGLFYNQFMLAISVLSCFQFIYQTYLEGHSDLLNTFKKLELGIACLFLFDWCLYLFVSEHKWAYLLSFFSLVDLMTVIPIFVLYEGVSCPSYEGINSGMEGFYYVMCGMNTTRILRALRFRKHFLKMEDEVKQCLSNMSLYIIVMILFNSAVIHYLEPGQHYPFHTWTYYMLVTVATVGYGDITPQTDLGRFAAMAMIGFAIITVPKMTNELIEKIAAQSVYARAVYAPLTANGKASHVLVCGDLKSSSLKEFFEELFHEDHDTQNLQAVILQPESPSYEMMTILKDIAYSQCVTYLEGNTLNEKDLKRASAETAKAIFIMTNKFTSDPDQEDAKTILQQFSIQRYLRLNSISKLKTLFCMQLIRPENKRHLVAPAEGTEVSDLVACLNEIKMGVIAKAVIFPGANTLIMNLLTSFADEDDGAGGSSVKEDLGIETLDDDVENDWLGEYQRGCDWEIYTTGLADAFEGSVFSHLSEILYQKLGVVLFALQIESKSKDRPWMKLLLNPSQYVIPSKEEFKIEAFVLAKNKAMSDLTFSKQADHDSLLKGGISFSHLSVLAGGLSKGIGNLAPNAPHLPGRSGGGGGGGQRLDELSTDNTYEMVGKEKRAAAWQALLRKHEMEKTTETIQEENQKLEDKYLRDNFYLKDTGVVSDLADAIIRTSVMEEMPYVDNHIIIIGKALSNLYDLIRPLRSKHLGVLKHIVILYPSDFPIAVWQRISIFESIWIVRGSALEEADIRRSGIFRAKQVVVLADASSDSALPSNAGSAAGLDALTDADAIFCYQCVRRMNETAQVVVEIVRHTNVGYLDPESGMNSSQIDYKFTPQFASGALFASSFLDTLVCQSFYNTKIIDVVNKLIGGLDNRSDADKKSTSKTMMGSSLYQINIPDGLESRTYGALYKLLAKRGQIPLGILRGVFAHTKSGPKANKMPYVFTNPPRDTELFSCDKVFVLSQTPIKIGKSAKDDSKEMMIYQNIRYKKKTAEDIIAMVNVLRDDVKSFEESHYNIDAKVTSMTSEFNRKFEILFNMLNGNKKGTGAIPGTPKSPSGGGGSKHYNNNNNSSHHGSGGGSRSPSPTNASRVREKRTSSV